MGERVRSQLGSALPYGDRQGAPDQEHGIDRESMSTGIRNMLLAWGEGHDPRDDDERLEAIRRGPRFVGPSNPEAEPGLGALVHLPQLRDNQGAKERPTT